MLVGESLRLSVQCLIIRMYTELVTDSPQLLSYLSLPPGRPNIASLISRTLVKYPLLWILASQIKYQKFSPFLLLIRKVWRQDTVNGIDT